MFYSILFIILLPPQGNHKNCNNKYSILPLYSISILFLRLHSVCRDTNFLLFTVGRTVGTCLIPSEYVRWLHNMHVLKGGV